MGMQAELSERLGVTAQVVSNWGRGETLPDISVLPDLAVALYCSVDAILSGGSGCGGYRCYITAAQMRGALACIQQMGELLGQDHFIYRCIIDALDTRMNTTIERAFSDPHIFEVFVGEFLLECVRKGDPVDPRDAAGAGVHTPRPARKGHSMGRQRQIPSGSAGLEGIRCDAPDYSRSKRSASSRAARCMLRTPCMSWSSGRPGR